VHRLPTLALEAAQTIVGDTDTATALTATITGDEVT